MNTNVTKSDDAYTLRRKAEVDQINAHARDKGKSALARDQWLLRGISVDYESVLTEEQIQEVKDFWKPYEFAYQNDWRLQAMYSAISGKFDPSYFGFGLQRYLLLPFFNHTTFQMIGDKSFTHLFFPEAKMPRTLLINCGGEYLDEHRNRIHYQEAVDVLFKQLENSRYGEGVIKPARGGEGKDITFLSRTLKKSELENILKRYGRDYICQEVIKNHESFARLYSGSLNTLRMCTFLWRDEVKFAGAVLRMGTTKRVDNWSQGGLACGVDASGRLQKYAFTEKGEKVTAHPATHCVFEGYKLYKFQEATELVKHLHAKIPQQKYISWDITVDEDGDLELIELNSPGSHELLQMSGQNGYGNRETVKEIFDKYLVESFFYERATFEWDYREFSNHVSLRKWCGLSEIIYIPAHIDGKPVRFVYENSINDARVKEIHVPASVIMNPKACTRVAEDCKIITSVVAK